MANRLANATSPYLRQHADNPVDWWEWEPAAFDEAKRRDVPVFLSIGYSSCHWCHVMAHESFNDDDIAALLNQRFVPIKVDREERPDIDSVYMSAVQAMTGRGGWPMSVFLMPDGTPFYGGTYWPRESRHNMPGFVDVLKAIGTAWRDQRDQVLSSGQQLLAHLAQTNELGAGAEHVDPATAQRAAALTVRMWDRELGGFGPAPKFPQAMTIDFLLAHHLRTGDSDAQEAAVHTLDAMAAGGMYDHVGGGFARYSTDAQWLVPHFEKMLYDNALLLRAYTHGAQVATTEEHRLRFRRVAGETADYLLREMQHRSGGFFSATDADSEGIEGKFFTWSGPEFDEVLSAAGEDPAEFRAFYGVTDAGNFSDPHHPEVPASSILHEPVRRDESDEDFAKRLQRVREALYSRREQRVHPGLDDKILTSWNALALGALAEAGAVLHEPRYVAAAQRCARFLQESLVVDDHLKHTWKDGHGATIPAFLEDVSYLAQALLVLYETDHDPAWLRWAAELAHNAQSRFAEEDDNGSFTGAYFTTAHDAEQLLTRPKDLWDNAQPAGSSVLVDVHLRLAALTGAPAHQEAAERTLALFSPRAEQAPTAYGELLRGLERLLSGPVELAIVGPPDDPSTALLVDAYRQRWRPGAVLAVGAEGDEHVPLLEARPMLDGRPAAYVCRNFACKRPVADPGELQALLERS
ncbi:MAG: DUF255 domain-containing protein [Nitriliruptorales bacterium]|nr:DUF255 domain-containing protein [Nitriliruptorales bacterium]